MSEFLQLRRIQVLVSFFLVVIVAIAVRAAMWNSPAAVYKFRQTSVSSQCSAIKPGMTLTDVEKLIHSQSTPMDEGLISNRLVFGNWDMCEVELDSSGQKVTQAYMTQSRIH